jgi:hypothetical protein
MDSWVWEILLVLITFFSPLFTSLHYESSYETFEFYFLIAEETSKYSLFKNIEFWP